MRRMLRKQPLFGTQVVFCCPWIPESHVSTLCDPHRAKGENQLSTLQQKEGMSKESVT